LQECIFIDNKMILVGSKLVANSKADRRGICRNNEVVTVIKIKIEDHIPYIGVHSENEHSLWGTLDGHLEDKHGLWLEGNSLFSYFNIITDSITIGKDFNFKNKNLKGMDCKILHQDKRNNQYFVEFLDNIGGGSADGLGKSGHCVAIPGNLLEVKENLTTNKFRTRNKLFALDASDMEPNQESNTWIPETDKNPDFLNQLTNDAMEVFNKAKLKIIEIENTNLEEVLTKAHDKARFKTKLKMKKNYPDERYKIDTSDRPVLDTEGEDWSEEEYNSRSTYEDSERELQQLNNDNF
jgi:hypothetical protein